MANKKTQKKREYERKKKMSRSSFFDYKFNTPSTIKMEGDDSDGNRLTQSRVSGGASIPSGESAWD